MYLDQEKRPTIGVGHLIRPGESFGGGITREVADKLLASDLAGAEGAINSRVKVPLTQGQFDALVSLVFNCGAGPLLGTLGRRLNAGDYDGAVEAWSAWCHGRGGIVLPVLVGRRGREIQAFRDAAPEGQLSDNPY